MLFRYASKNHFYALVNIFGLSLAFTCITLISIYIYYELSFEQYHTKQDRIYRVTYAFNSGSGFNVHWARVPVDYVNELSSEYSMISQLVRFQNHERKYVKIDREKFRPKHAYTTDQEVFEVFDFNWISGDIKSALQEPNSVVLSKKTAIKYFGSHQVLGRDIEILGDWNSTPISYKVTGIFEDFPSNTHLPIELLMSFKNEEERSGWAYTYILLQNDGKISDLEGKMTDFIQRHHPDENADKVSFVFQELADIHLHSNLAREIIPNGDAFYIQLFAGIGVLIIVLAISNFVNLHSTLIISRNKEIGMRKILGSDKSLIAFSLLLETLFYFIISAILGFLIAFLVLPSVEQLLQVEFNIPVYQLFVINLFIALSGALLSTIYPYQMVKGITGIDALNSGKRTVVTASSRKLNAKNVFLTLQFSISILLIVSALIAHDQLEYLINKDLGMDPRGVLSIAGLPDAVKDEFETFKIEASQIPGVELVSGCMEVPSREIRDSGPVLVRGVNEDPDMAPIMDAQIIGHDFLDVLNIKLVAGQGIPQSLGFDEIPPFTESYNYMDYLLEKRRAYIINESAMRQLGWQDPEEALGKEINWSIGDIKLDFGPIVGVTQEFHQGSLRNEIEPVIMFFEPIWLRTFLIRINESNMDTTIKDIKKVWDTLFPAYPMEYQFLDDLYAKHYTGDRMQLRLLYTSSGIAILIALIGIFGLITYTLKTRNREMAIRKILGARLSQLILLINSDYTIIVLISSLIGIPLSYYFVNMWLDSFAYKAQVDYLQYLYAILLVYGLLMLVVVFRTLKTNRINPANTLREQ